MTAPLVSVLMPAYNHERYVSAAVASVLGQTHANLELIAIDDASSDGTWDVLSSIRDDRVLLHRHTSNQGAHASLNEAIEKAQGDYVTILNSDDIYAPTRLAQMLAKSPGAGKDWFAFSDVVFIDEAGESALTHPRAEEYADLCDRCTRLRSPVWFLAGNPAISTSNFLISRSLLNKVGDFAPLRFTHDWDWALRACRHVVPAWVHEPLLSYRVHPSSTLAEGDAWRHIHENSHIQAMALLGNRACEGHPLPLDACRAMLGNPSFHPLALAIYLVYGLYGGDESGALELTKTPAGKWWLSQLAEEANYPASIFDSVRNLRERDAVIAGQAALNEERMRVIERMDVEIANRDEAIAGQAALNEERQAVIERMSAEIAHRDEAIAGQAALIDERMDIINKMGLEIAHRDQAITAQAAMLEERMRAIDHMSQEIASRDDAIAALKAELELLRANPVVRIVERIMNRMGQ